MSSARVLVVDDSAFVRKHVREILERAGFDVVDVARDGLEALEKIAQLGPDVVTLDLSMPHLDGLGVLDQLSRTGRRPAVVVVSISGPETEAGLVALERGAVSIVEKPTALATRRLLEMEPSIVAEVRAAAAARAPAPLVTPRRVEPAPRTSEVALVVMGASTGGPRAITEILTALPGGLPVPIAIVVHIPPGYTAALANRIDAASALSVVEVSEGLAIEPGMAAIARAGLHLAIERGARAPTAQLTIEPLGAVHRPSVDVLFETAAEAYGDAVLGVVLTGMGSDGLIGARAIRERGGRVLVESASSSVVYGMPRVVAEAGLASAEAPIERMAELLLESL